MQDSVWLIVAVMDQAPRLAMVGCGSAYALLCWRYIRCVSCAWLEVNAQWPVKSIISMATHTTMLMPTFVRSVAHATADELQQINRLAARFNQSNK